jgi:two-component system cell cycle sensor histidine kinase/response regulator CckA
VAQDPEVQHTGALNAPLKTILLVDDDFQVRNLLTKVLGNCGYRIIPARDGFYALEQANAFQGHIDLLLSDVDMPGITGCTLANRLRILRPLTKVLLMSGVHTPETAGPGHWEFLPKPFRMDTLLAKIASTLASATHRAPADPGRSIAQDPTRH